MQQEREKKNEPLSFQKFNNYDKYHIPNANVATVDHNQRKFNSLRPIPQLQDRHLKPMPTVLKQKILVIDSRDRDTDKWPNPTEFTVAMDSYNGASFNENIYNIKDITLEQCIVHDFTHDFPYLVIHMPELQQRIAGTNKNIREAFGIFVPDHVVGNYVNCKPLRRYHNCEFNPPLAQIPNFKVKYLTPDGDLFEPIGLDAEDVETLLIMKVTLEIPHPHVIDYRIV